MAATFTATAEPANFPPRMRLDVSVTAGAGVSAFIVRLDPDGRTQVVRLADPALMLGFLTWVGYDYEAPYGAAVTYTAVVTYTNPGTIVATLTDTETLPVPDVWLVHPGIPALSMMLAKVTNLGDRTRPVNRGVFEPYGRETPLVVTDGRRKAAQASLQIRTQTISELGAFQALTSDAATLLLNVPTDLGWGLSNEYVSFGDLGESREVQTGNDPYRLHTVPYLVVGRPVGGSQAQRTYADVIAEAAAYQQVLDMRLRYLDLLAPTSPEVFVSSGLYDGTAAGFVEEPAGSHLYQVP